MKEEKIIDALAFTDEKLLEEADEFRRGKKKKQGKYGALVAAACICVVAAVTVAGVRYSGRISPAPPVNSESSTQTLHEINVDGFLNDGMGHEGWMLKNISEWTSSKKIPYFKTLPVYSVKGNGINEKEMNEVIDNVISLLGIPEAEFERRYEYASEIYGEIVQDYVYAVEAVASGGRIRAFSKGGYSIIFNEGGTVPAGCSDEEIAEYYAEKYKMLLGTDKIRTEIRVDYNVYGKRMVSYSFYACAENELEEMTNREFSSMKLDIIDDRLMSIIVDNSLASAETVGNYPVISLREARKKLAEGDYITSSPYDFAGAEYADAVELVYRKSGDTCVPYYLFYVEEINAPTKDYGLKDYSSYYVPAVEEEFIKYSGYGE